MSVQLQLKGFEETVEYIEAIDVPGQLNEQLGIALTDMTRLAAAITPVKTGAMRDAWEYQLQGLTGIMLINATARNPESGILVTDYAPIIAEREGILGMLPVAQIKFEIEV